MNHAIGRTQGQTAETDGPGPPSASLASAATPSAVASGLLLASTGT